MAGILAEQSSSSRTVQSLRFVAGAPGTWFWDPLCGVAPAGQYGFCPNGNNLDKRRWTVDSAVVVRNYVMDDTIGAGGVRTKMAVKQLDCVVSPPDNSGITNHVELKISQNQIDIYATDAGVAPSPANLKRIAVVTDANLSLTRGLIWLEDVHYNADKANPDRMYHRKSNTRLYGTTWLLTGRSPTGISATMPWTSIKPMRRLKQ